MPNRLSGETSPYLLQHQDNPVDWWPWSEPAFAEARSRDVPVLLSVGYAACHWCHVMAHESFEDPLTARVMNAGFVSIKVDREERPDVDAVYMDYATALTGHGGWPLTAFLTPDGRAFYAGTYFPPQPLQGRPSFRQVLEAVSATWRERRDEVEAAATGITERLATASAPQGTGPPDADDLALARRVLATTYDRDSGGFGGAPKFPPSMVLEWLIRHHARSRDPEAWEMARGTWEAMVRGGIYDQLGGGFARYAVDAHWVVPHFEKMLYDNALLLRVGAHLQRSRPDPVLARTVTETAEFLLRDLLTAEGGFASSLDADAAGEEGSTYVWTPAQLVEALGVRDGGWATGLLGVTVLGTFERGSSVLQLREEPDDVARWEGVRATLLEARGRRPQPGRDDKVVTAWNGLAIAALADAGAVLGRDDWVAAATRCAGMLLALHRDPAGRLRRASRDGAVGDAVGVLEDYGDLAEGLLTLYAVTAEPRWFVAAGELLDVVLEVFADGSGGFFDTASDAEALVRRPRDPTDNATPSGTSAAAGALLSWAALSGSSRHRAAAEAALSAAGVLATQHPRFAGWGLAVAEALAAGPLEVAVIGPREDPRASELRQEVLASSSPGLVLAVGDPGQDVPPLLADRGLVAGAPAAYVCRGFVCERPVSTVEELRRLLR